MAVAHPVWSVRDLIGLSKQIGKDTAKPLDFVLEGETMRERYTRASATWAEGIESDKIYTGCLLEGQTVLVPCTDDNYTWRLIDRNKNRVGWLDDMFTEASRQIVEREGTRYCTASVDYFLGMTAGLENLVAFVE